MIDKSESSNWSAIDQDTDSVIRRLRVHLTDQFGSNNNMLRQLQYAFEEVCENIDEKISKRDFVQILNKLKVIVLKYYFYLCYYLQFLIAKLRN